MKTMSIARYVGCAKPVKIASARNNGGVMYIEYKALLGEGVTIELSDEVENKDELDALLVGIKKVVKELSKS
jgi:hypothetical protein